MFDPVNGYFVEAEMAREGYASANEFLRALIREAQKRRAKREVEAMFREALESGPAIPMNRDDRDDLERMVWERHRTEQPLKS